MNWIIIVNLAIAKLKAIISFDWNYNLCVINDDLSQFLTYQGHYLIYNIWHIRKTKLDTFKVICNIERKRRDLHTEREKRDLHTQWKSDIYLLLLLMGSSLAVRSEVSCFFWSWTFFYLNVNFFSSEHAICFPHS